MAKAFPLETGKTIPAANITARVPDKDFLHVPYMLTTYIQVFEGFHSEDARHNGEAGLSAFDFENTVVPTQTREG